MPRTETYAFDSPVEFVLVGPAEPNRGVIAKSKGAGLDLIGYAATTADDIHSRRPRGPLPLNFFVSEDEILSVQSHLLHNVVDDPDDRRLSRYSLIWRGLASNRQMEKIERELSRRAPDLGVGLRDGNREEIEWHLAALVSQCAEARQRYRHLQRQRTAVIVVGVVIYLVIGITWLLQGKFFG